MVLIKSASHFVVVIVALCDPFVETVSIELAPLPAALIQVVDCALFLINLVVEALIGWPHILLRLKIIKRLICN